MLLGWKWDNLREEGLAMMCGWQAMGTGAEQPLGGPPAGRSYVFMYSPNMGWCGAERAPCMAEPTTPTKAWDRHDTEHATDRW